MSEQSVLAIVILSYMLNLITTIIAIVRITVILEHRLTKLESTLEIISNKFDLRYIERKGV